MNFDDFVKECSNYIVEFYNNQVTVRIVKSIKNNGRKLTGINVLDKDVKVTPTIYLDGYYFDYQNGRSFCDITDEIIRQYERAYCKDVPDLAFLQNVEDIKGRVLLKVINYEKNLELLENTPYIKYLDLAVVFYIDINLGSAGNGSILITNNYLSNWDISLEDLYDCAINNSLKSSGVEIIKMDDILLEMMLQKGSVDDLELFKNIIISGQSFEDYFKMYVLSNKNRSFGAYAILDNDTLLNLANKMDDDLYIIPSSVHEIIVMPKNNIIATKELGDAIRDTNTMHVALDEVLSDSLYEFVRSKNEVRICV